MVIWSRIQILDHISSSLTIIEYGILGDLLISISHHRPIFTTLGKMTDADT